MALKPVMLISVACLAILTIAFLTGKVVLMKLHHFPTAIKQSWAKRQAQVLVFGGCGRS